MSGADAPLDHAPLAIDEFEFGEAQKERMGIDMSGDRQLSLLGFKSSTWLLFKLV